MVGTILKTCSPNLEAWVCLPFSGLVASSYGWILPVFMKAGLGRIFENVYVLILEVGASCFEVGPWSGAGLFILCEDKVYASTAVIAAEALGVFWRLSSTLNTLSDFAWTSTILYGTFKRRWFDSIDPGCRPLTNKPAAWTESALCTRDITSRKHDKYSLRDSFAACSNRSRSRMVFCCLRAPAYYFKKRHSLVPGFQGHLLLKVVYVIEGSVFPSNGLKVGVVKSLGLGSIWIQSVKAVRLIPRIVCSARSSRAAPPSFLASNWEAHLLLSTAAPAWRGLVWLCRSPCICDLDGVGTSLGGWPPDSCWTSS
ncbi:hypothetical protein PanWU01x14_338680 [Parasponia andersonii]|uniref:Uncharacterized protein n=1 Tax=Parasponia andersonii TaxID=3476 RepID=A0A2P5AF16_PARAD|nr:hypothetical protein PanWU01x14_338680 [Parasponia andersonii]